MNGYALQILKSGRLHLIDCFLHDLKLHTALFKYEKNKEVMSLFKEGYFINWVNYHFQLIKEEKTDDKQAIERIVLCINKLINNIEEEESLHSEILIRLLTQKKEIINQLIESEVFMQRKLDKLILSYERDRVLFERALEHYVNINNS